MGQTERPTKLGPRQKAAAERRKIHHGCCDDGWLYFEDGDEACVVKCPGTGEEPAR